MPRVPQTLRARTPCIPRPAVCGAGGGGRRQRAQRCGGGLALQRLGRPGGRALPHLGQGPGSGGAHSGGEAGGGQGRAGQHAGQRAGPGWAGQVDGEAEGNACRQGCCALHPPLPVPPPAILSLRRWRACRGSSAQLSWRGAASTWMGKGESLGLSVLQLLFRKDASSRVLELSKASGREGAST